MKPTRHRTPERSSFNFSPEDWPQHNASEGWTEPGTVQLDSEDPYLQWVSGPSLFEGCNLPAKIDAATIDITGYDIGDDGQGVAGDARFVELNAALGGTPSESSLGTFSFSCPPQG